MLAAATVATAGAAALCRRWDHAVLAYQLGIACHRGQFRRRERLAGALAVRRPFARRVAPQFHPRNLVIRGLPAGKDRAAGEGDAIGLSETQIGRDINLQRLRLGENRAVADIPVADAAVDDGKRAERLDAEPDLAVGGFLGNLDVAIQEHAAGLARQGDCAFRVHVFHAPPLARQVHRALGHNGAHEHERGH